MLYEIRSHRLEEADLELLDADGEVRLGLPPCSSARYRLSSPMCSDRVATCSASPA